MTSEPAKSAVAIRARILKYVHVSTYDSVMVIKSSVFGSKSERELFIKLQTRWTEKGFSLYPSLPFASLIDVDGLGVNPKERNFLLKTSVDYTFCEAERPIMSVDFDGMGDGFGRRGEYVQLRPQWDPHRKLKFDLKLRICRDERYPYFVVSFPEKEWVGPDLTITLVDGIVGQVLARRQFESVIQGEVDRERTFIDGLPLDERDEVVQDIVSSVEVDTAMEWDPLQLEAAKYEGIAWRNKLLRSERSSFLEDPKRPAEAEFSFTLGPEKMASVLQSYLEHEKHVERIGCEVVLETNRGQVSQTCWVRNINGYGASPLILAESTAKLLAFKKLVDNSQRLIRHGNAA